MGFEDVALSRELGEREPPPVPRADAAADEDVRLIAAVARRDRRSFERLYTKYAHRVFRFAFRLSRDQSKSEEVVNDVMLEIWKSAAEFGGRSAPSTWIFGIARHRTLNALRGRTLYIGDSDEAAEVADPAPSPEERVDGGRIRERLQAALERLSTEQREVIELAFVEGLNYRQIAAIAKCPENTVKTRMFHARKKLEPLLTRLLGEGDQS
jgi:RNA polymerase sigma-70 factor (ECF subfamily)